jgi:hypothetical protein
MDPIRRPVHPRIQRRRDLVASLNYPAEQRDSLNYPAELRETFGKFTDSQLAVLKIVSGEVSAAVAPLTRGARPCAKRSRMALQSSAPINHLSDATRPRKNLLIH